MSLNLSSIFTNNNSSNNNNKQNAFQPGQIVSGGISGSSGGGGGNGMYGMASGSVAGMAGYTASVGVDQKRTKALCDNCGYEETDATEKYCHLCNAEL